MAKTFAARLNSAIDRVHATRRKDLEEGLALVLRAHGGQSLQSLMSVLTNRDAPTSMRSTACFLLGQIGYKRAATALLQTFQEDDRTLMWEVAKWIPHLRSKRTAPALLEILNSPASDQEHRVAAAYAVGFSSDSRAIDPLVRVLEDRAQHPELRGHVAEALGYLGDARAVGYLTRALSDPSAEIRYWAAFALGKIGDRRALRKLRELATTDDGNVPGLGSVRDEAAAAVEQIRNTANNPAKP